MVPASGPLWQRQSRVVGFAANPRGDISLLEAPEMAAFQKIVLLKREPVVVARPSSVVAEPGDKIRFLNLSDVSIELAFPNGPFAAGNTVAAGSFWDVAVPANRHAHARARG